MEKIKTLKEIRSILPPWTATLVGGVFDLFHVGHLRFLRECAKLGRPLVVIVQSDQTVRIRKGFNRPIIGQLHRAEIISSLEMVDYVLILDRVSHHPSYISAIKPKNYVFSRETRRYRKRVIEELKKKFPKTNFTFSSGRITPRLRTSEIIKKVSRIRDYETITDPIKRRLYEIADASKAIIGKISALATINGEIIISESDNDETRDVHAEIEVIRKSKAQGFSLSQVTLYTLIPPCANCAEEIVRNGIKEVYYLHPYGNQFGQKILREAGIKIARMK